MLVPRKRVSARMGVVVATIAKSCAKAGPWSADRLTEAGAKGLSDSIARVVTPLARRPKLTRFPCSPMTVHYSASGESDKCLRVDARRVHEWQEVPAQV